MKSTKPARKRIKQTRKIKYLEIAIQCLHSPIVTWKAPVFAPIVDEDAYPHNQWSSHGAIGWLSLPLWRRYPVFTSEIAIVGKSSMLLVHSGSQFYLRPWHPWRHPPQSHTCLVALITSHMAHWSKFAIPFNSVVEFQSSRNTLVLHEESAAIGMMLVVLCTRKPYVRHHIPKINHHYKLMGCTATTYYKFSHMKHRNWISLHIEHNSPMVVLTFNQDETNINIQ